MAVSDDTELLQAAREGDATAFDTLIRRHDRFLYRVARSILLDDYEAEDVVQETFIKAFKRLVDFRGEASLSTWLTRIALNVALRVLSSHALFGGDIRPPETPESPARLIPALALGLA
jgi:RNA polymerase sigma factor (sigma-70 family)